MKTDAMNLKKNHVWNAEKEETKYIKLLQFWYIFKI